MDTPDPASPPSPPTFEELSTALNRLLTALIAAEPRLLLLHYGPGGAEVYDPEEKKRIVAIVIPPDAGYEQVRKLLGPHVDTLGLSSPETHVVVVGGSSDAAGAIERVGGSLPSKRAGLHHLDGSGELRRVAGKPLPALAAALERALHEPYDPLVLPEAAARTRATVGEQQRVAAKLQGRNTWTAIFCAVCVLLFVLGYVWTGGAQDRSLWAMGANNGAAVRAGQWYRLWASAFLHIGAIHLLMNMLALWSAGPLLEAILGPRRYVLLYGGSALGGALASAFFGDKISAGASGAIWGLMAAIAALTVKPRGVLPQPMIDAMKGRVWTPLVINGLYSLQPGIDMLAHLGGGVAGFALMAVLTADLVPVDERPSPRAAERGPRPLLSLAAAVVAGGMALSVIVALVAGKPWRLDAPPELARVAIADTGLTAELPDGLTPAQEPGSNGPTLVSFIGKGIPVQFEIVVANLPGVPAAGEMDATMDGIRAELDNDTPKGWTKTRPAAKTTIGSRPAVLAELETDKGVNVTCYAVVAGPHVVLVRGYSSKKNRPAAWAEVEQRVAASVAVR